jgi:hypothetical protein
VGEELRLPSRGGGALRRTALNAFRKCLIVVGTRNLSLQDELPRRIHRYIHGPGIRACAVAPAPRSSRPSSRHSRARIRRVGAGEQVPYASVCTTLAGQALFERSFCFMALVGIEHLVLLPGPRRQGASVVSRQDLKLESDLTSSVASGCRETAACETGSEKESILLGNECHVEPVIRQCDDW